MKEKRKARIKLDAEEQALLESVESGEWKTVENVKEERVFAKAAAGNYQRKDAGVNICIATSDFEPC